MTHINETISREIDLFLEQIYGDSKQMGDELAAVGLGKTQLRGLETLITSTSRFSEIINYIKNQAAKDTKKTTWIRVAPGVIRQLEALEVKAQEIGSGDPSLVLDIKMKLARGWGKQVIFHCLYKLQLNQEEAGHHGQGI